ncbi:MAG TPA: hypothetical protein VF590_22625, partial [Isosphaeraceae bacterium]
MNRPHRAAAAALLASVVTISSDSLRLPVPGPTDRGAAPTKFPPPAAQLATAPDLWAVVIGIDRYHDPRVPDCPGAAAGARALRDWLVQTAGWESEHVLLMDDVSPTKHRGVEQTISKLSPTAENLTWAIRGWLEYRVKPKDVVLVYFAGRAADGAGEGGGPPDLRPLAEETGRAARGSWSLADSLAALATGGENPILIGLDLPGPIRLPVKSPGFDPAGLAWLNVLGRWPTTTICLSTAESSPRANLPPLASALGRALGDGEHQGNLLASLARLDRDAGGDARGFQRFSRLDPGPSLWKGSDSVLAPEPAPAGPPGHAASVHNVVMAGDLVVTGADDSTAKLWRVDSTWSATRRSLLLQDVLDGQELGVTALAVDADGRWLATGDGSGRVRIAHREEGRPTAFVPDTGPTHAEAVVRLAFVPGAARLVSLDRLGRAFLWDSMGQMPPMPLAPALEVTDLACGPGRIAVAAIDEDGTRHLRLFGPDGRPLAELPDPGGTVRAGRLMFAGPHGEMLAAVADEGRVTVWDIGHGAEIRERARFDFPARAIRAMALAPPIVVLGVADDVQLRFLDRPASSLRLPAGDRVDRVLLSEGGRWLAAITRVGGLRVWARTDKFAFAPVFDASSGVVSAAFDARGRVLVAGCQDGSIRTWDLARGEERPPVPGLRDGASGLSLAPDGRFLLRIDSGGEARVWDLREGRAQTPIPGRWTAGTFLADGRGLLMADDQGDIALVDRATGLRRPSPRFAAPLADGGDGVSCWGFDRLAASPDGLLFAAGCSRGPLACVWDAGGKLVRAIRTHSEAISAVAFSTDSRRLLVACLDGTASVWDLDAGAAADRPRWSLAADDAGSDAPPVTAAAFVPTAPTRIVTGHADGRVLLWEIGPGDQPAATPLGTLKGEVRTLTVA